LVTTRPPISRFMSGREIAWFHEVVQGARVACD
jgi:hypothetical protein